MKPRDTDRKAARPPTNSSIGNAKLIPFKACGAEVTAPSAFDNPEYRFPNSSAHR